MQFMLPAGYIKREPSIGEVFKDSFLNIVKERGLDEAIKTFDEATSTWSAGKELSPKGLIVSNDAAYQKWVPFGPAIRGVYADYGNCEPLDDEDSQNRVKILEALMGDLPFNTIMSVAQDDRWYTLGLGKYVETGDNDWRPEGISKDMPEWLLKLCQQLSLTYFHADVYNELKSPDFSANEIGGIMKDSYEIKWKNEYLDPIKKDFPKVLENLRIDGDRPADMEARWANREILNSIGTFRNMNREIGLIYQACIARENPPLDWFYESLDVMYSLSTMQLILDRSYYGSQSYNWAGWNRINKKLSATIEMELNDDNEDDLN